MRVHCACEPTESRESNKIECIYALHRVHNHIFLRQDAVSNNKEKYNTKRTCLLIKFVVHIFQFVSVVDWNIVSIPP